MDTTLRNPGTGQLGLMKTPATDPHLLVMTSGAGVDLYLKRETVAPSFNFFFGGGLVWGRMGSQWHCTNLARNHSLAPLVLSVPAVLHLERTLQASQGEPHFRGQSRHTPCHPTALPALPPTTLQLRSSLWVPPLGCSLPGDLFWHHLSLLLSRAAAQYTSLWNE